MTIQLRTLGSVDLAADDRPGVASVLAQPKRFALLTYLAVAAPGRFARRDTVLALFWPETDQARGRNVLRQTVFRLRQSLGPEVIRGRGDEEIGVAADAVECDVRQFEALLAAGENAEALQLYRGDFLAGFHVPDAAPEFDEWMEVERRRLRALATDAAWSLAVGEEQEGRADRAAPWVRRSLVLDPLNEKRVTDAMQLFARMGDRAAALNVYHDYVRRAQEDLGIAPDRAVRRLADELRVPPEAASIVTAPIIPGPVVTDAVPVAREVRVTTPSPRVWRRRAWRVGVPAAVCIAIGVVLLRGIAATTTLPVVAVGPITEAAANGAAHMPADLLSTSLGRLSGIQVIPVTRLMDVQSQLRAASRTDASLSASATHAGADELIEGTLLRLPNGNLRFDLRVSDSRTGAVKRTYHVEGADLFAAVDAATAQIAASYGVAAPVEGIARVTTTSLIAYRLYDQAMHARYEGDTPAAHRLFQAALEEDSTFAAAAFYAGEIAYHAGKSHESDTLLARAERLAARTSDRERLFILHRVAGLRMSPAAFAYADTLATRYPFDPDAQYAKGIEAASRGDFTQAVAQFRRVIAMDSLSLRDEGRCRACDAYANAWWAYIMADSFPAAERMAREFGAARPRDADPSSLLMTVLVRLGRYEEAWQESQQVELRGGSVNADHAKALVAIRKNDFAEADERLGRLMLEGNPSMREEAGWFLVLSLRNQGRYAEALSVALKVQPLAHTVVLLEMGRSGEAGHAFERMARSIASDAPAGHRARHQAWLYTHVATSAAAAGDTARLQQLADLVERIGRQSAYGRDGRLHHYIRGLLWNARGQPRRAADEFTQSVFGWTDGYTRANYELAKATLALRQPERAIYPLQAALRGDLQSSNLYVTRTELHELLAQAFDQAAQPDSAAKHYAAVVGAWQRADPALQQRRRAAQQRIVALTRTTARGMQRP